VTAALLAVLAGLVGVAGDVRDAVGETFVRLGQVLVGSGQERDEGGGVVGAERLV